MVSATSTSTSTDYSSYVQTLYDEIQAYCEANGIDSEQYLNSLDGADSAIAIDDPSLEAYFKLAYIQLIEILFPEVMNSIEAEVGGEVDYDTLVAHLGSDMDALIQQVLQDDPELMAYFAYQAGGEVEAENVFAILSGMTDSSTTGGGTASTADAEEFADDYDMGDWFDWVIDEEDAFDSSMNSILTALAEIDQSFTDLADALSSGEISETEYQAELQSVSMMRELYMTMLTQLSEQKMVFFEMLSKLIEQQIEAMTAIVQNMKSV